jgi:hypothetical protein
MARAGLAEHRGQLAELGKPSVGPSRSPSTVPSAESDQALHAIREGRKVPQIVPRHPVQGDSRERQSVGTLHIDPPLLTRTAVMITFVLENGVEMSE